MATVAGERIESVPSWGLVGTAAAVDGITILACAVLSASVLGYPSTGSADAASDWFKLAIVVSLTWVITAWRLGAYSRRLWNSGVELYVLVLRSAPISFSISLVAGYFAFRDIGGVFILVFLSLVVCAVLAERRLLRFVVHTLHRKGYLASRVIIVGRESEVRSLQERLSSETFSGLVVEEAYIREGGAYKIDGRIVADSLVGLSARLAISHVPYVIICGEMPDVEELDSLCWDLRDRNVSISLVVDLAYASIPPMDFRVASGLPLLEFQRPGLSRSGIFIKRSFDVVTSAIALVLLAPVFIIVAVLIMVEDGRPILFRQERVGIDGVKFPCAKFRSMYKDAASRERELRAIHHKPGQMWKVEDDPRVTRVGRFLRATSIDELPQLFNVLRGEMSIVGPRPKQAWELEDYNSRQLRRLSVKPGLTGLSQVSGRSDLSIDEATRLDIDYCENWSILLDIAICLRTVVVVSRGSGAY